MYTYIFKGPYDDEKLNKILLIYKEIQSGAVSKSYMTNGLLIYGENICAFPHHILGSTHTHLNFPIYEENFVFFFISVSPFLPLYPTGL
jgi:hypothetical protein